ncbi:MAG: PTS galactosamine/N-acetylgalactosamine transporter subunit IIA [Erysipelotrichaceae bacterium]
MIGLVVVGHGNFGTGLTSSLNLIAGEQKDYFGIDFLQEDTPEILEAKLKKAFDSLSNCDGIIVMADLAGGSPFKVAATLAQSYDSIEVIGGSNLPMLCEIAMARSVVNDLNSLVTMAVNTGRNQIMKFEIKKPQAVDETDGI